MQGSVSYTRIKGDSYWNRKKEKKKKDWKGERGERSIEERKRLGEINKTSTSAKRVTKRSIFKIVQHLPRDGKMKSRQGFSSIDTFHLFMRAKVLHTKTVRETGKRMAKKKWYFDYVILKSTFLYTYRVTYKRDFYF